jgi:hypothetical protein
LTTEIFNAPVNEQVGESQEYIQAMVDKADGKVTPDAPLLAGKYKNEDELAKGTLELIKMKHGGIEEFYKTLESTQPVKSKEEEEATKETEVPKVDEVKKEEFEGIDKIEIPTANFEKYSTELIEGGTLSEDSYKELADKHGLPKEMVDTYIKGLQLAQESTSNKLIESVGSKQAYSDMITWAKDSLSREQIQVYNNAVDSNDYNQMELAVAGLHAKYKNSVGNTPTLVEGQPSGGMSGYQSMAEMKVDMSNPQYSKDPAFRQRVMDRARVTTTF